MVTTISNASDVERNDYVRFRTRFTFERFVDLPRDGAYRFLDFGCGDGHSIEALLDVYPQARFFGAEYEPGTLSRCLERLGSHPRVTIVQTKSPGSLDGIETGLDVIQLNAVYEHMLPDERRALMPELWRRIAAGGYLVLTETPWRWFPIETHSTSRPLVNYMPDRLALFTMRHFSKGGRFSHIRTLEEALRDGLRGATVPEIMASLAASPGSARIVASSAPDARDMLDVWWHGECRKTRQKQLAYSVLSAWRKVTGMVISPWVNLVVQKTRQE
jgi:SAM-dependent methyltransferase